MTSRVILAIAAMVAVAYADSSFDLRWATSDYSVVTDIADAKACFAATNITTVYFSYGYEYDNDDDEVTIEPEGPTSCANDKVDMYSDMVWAIDRDGEGTCFRFPVTNFKTVPSSSPNLANLPKPTNDFNQNYRYTITRKLRVCAFDSNYFPISDDLAGETTRKQKIAKNKAAEVKVSYQSDYWEIRVSNWDAALSTAGSWSTVAKHCAGHCDSLTGPPSDVKNPSLENYEGNKPDAHQQFFFDGDCQAKSSWTCTRGETAATTKCPTDPFEEDGDADFKKTKSGASAVQEQYACGSSAALLARSVGLTDPTSIVDETNDGDDWLIASTINTDVGIQEDVLGDDGLWSKIIDFAPTITKFNGDAVSGPEFDSKKTFWLNNKDVVTFQLANSNNKANQVGFASDNTNKIFVQTSLVGGAASSDGWDTDMKTVGFDIESQERIYMANKDAFDDNDQGSGDFGKVGEHFWATVQAKYAVQVKFSCKSIGDNDDEKFPFNFDCDTTLDAYKARPGQSYNNEDNDYPLMKRQFNSKLDDGSASIFPTTYGSAFEIEALSDPVYLGQWISATNNGFKTAAAVPAIDGSEAKAQESPELTRAQEQADAQTDQADGVALIGAGVVTLAVLGSVAIIVGAVLHAKMSAK